MKSQLSAPHLRVKIVVLARILQIYQRTLVLARQLLPGSTARHLLNAIHRPAKTAELARIRQI